jgi:hypothetical protein
MYCSRKIAIPSLLTYFTVNINFPISSDQSLLSFWKPLSTPPESLSLQEASIHHHRSNNNMFAIKIGTISAVLFTLVVMLLGKTVAGKRIRQPVAYDPVDHPHDPKNEHQDWTKDTIRSLQTTSCDVPGEGQIASKWIGDTCYELDLLDCCGPLLNFTTCTADKPYPGKWSNGVCSGYEQSDCCVVETGYTLFTFETCDAPDDQLPGQWDTDGTCTALSLSDCCGPLLNFTTCDTYERWPGKWSNGVCSGYEQSDCCVVETGYTYFTFETCDAPDEQLPGQWDTDGTCTAFFLSDCCGPVSGTTSSGNGGTTSSGNGGTTSSGNGGTASSGNGGTASSGNGGTTSSGNGGTASSGNGGSTSRGNGGTTSSGNGGTTPSGNGGTTSSESSSVGLIIGIVVALLIVAVLITLISCARCRSCPWYSKMCCSPKNQPVPTTNTVASSNAPMKEEVVDTDDQSVTEVPPETAAPESNGLSEAPSKMERLSGLWTTAKKAYQRASDMADTVEKYTASINNVTQIVETVQDDEEEVVVVSVEEVVMQEEEEAVQEEEEAIHEEEAVPEEDEVLEGQV